MVMLEATLVRKLVQQLVGLWEVALVEELGNKLAVKLATGLVLKWGVA